MNLTVYPNAKAWLLASKPAQLECHWSVGRWAPSVAVGDDLLFRFDGRVIARAICHEIYEPGAKRIPMFDGSRQLRGFLVSWLQRTFEDLSGQDIPRKFGDPPTENQIRLLRLFDQRPGYQGVFPEGTSSATVSQLLLRGLLQHDREVGYSTTREGKRVLARMDSEPFAVNPSGRSA